MTVIFVFKAWVISIKKNQKYKKILINEAKNLNKPFLTLVKLCWISLFE